MLEVRQCATAACARNGVESSMCSSGSRKMLSTSSISWGRFCGAPGKVGEIHINGCRGKW